MGNKRDFFKMINLYTQQKLGKNGLQCIFFAVKRPTYKYCLQEISIENVLAMNWANKYWINLTLKRNQSIVYFGNKFLSFDNRLFLKIWFLSISKLYNLIYNATSCPFSVSEGMFYRFRSELRHKSDMCRPIEEFKRPRVGIV